MKFFLLFLISLVLIGCSVNNDEDLVDFQSLELNEAEFELIVDETQIVQYQVYPEDYVIKDLQFQVLDENIASVENDVITALEIGETTIDVYYNNKLVASISVTVLPIMHSVTFESADLDSIVVEQSSMLSRAETLPEREGYTFLGWFYDENLTEPFLYRTRIEKDLTLYANWLKEDLVYNLSNDFLEGPYKPKSHPDYVIIDANPEKGFNFPYIIFLPSTLHEEDNLGYKRYLLFEGFNAYYTNDLDPDLDVIARWRQHFYGYMVQEELFIPRIMPILPEIALFDTSVFNIDINELKEIDVEDYYDYIDDNRMVYDTLFGYGYLNLNLSNYKESLFPRDYYDDDFQEFLFDLISIEELMLYDNITEQYLAIINDAQTRLNEAGWSLEEEIFLHGFSASGFFANRFATANPDMVQALFSGAFYYPVLPSDQYEEYELTFPLGTSNYLDLFGKEFELESYQAIPKLYYIGRNDDLDPLGGEENTGYPVAGYHLSHQDIAFDIFGKGDFFDRFDKMLDVYYSLGGNAVYIIDDFTDHSLLQHHHRMIVRFFEINRNQRGYHDYSFAETTVEYILPELVED